MIYVSIIGCLYLILMFLFLSAKEKFAYFFLKLIPLIFSFVILTHIIINTTNVEIVLVSKTHEVKND